MPWLALRPTPTPCRPPPGPDGSRCRPVVARSVRRTPPFRARPRPDPGAAGGLPRCPASQHPGRASARRARRRGRSHQQDAGARPGGSAGTSPAGRGGQPGPMTAFPATRRPPAFPFRHSRASTGMPGPVERAIRQRRVSDPVILLRAAAIETRRAAHNPSRGRNPVRDPPDTLTNNGAPPAAPPSRCPKLPERPDRETSSRAAAAPSQARQQFQQPHDPPGPLTVIIFASDLQSLIGSRWVAAQSWRCHPSEAPA